MLVVGAGEQLEREPPGGGVPGHGHAVLPDRRQNDIRPEWIAGAGRVGLTAGASTPEFLVSDVVEELRCRHGARVREVRVVEEDVRFGLPRELEDIARRAGKAHPGPERAARVQGGIARHAARHLPPRSWRAEAGRRLARGVLDLGGLYKDQATQRGTLRRGRGGFPRSLLEVIQGGEATWASVREVWEYGKGLVDQQAIEELATRRLAYPLKRVRLLAPIPSPARNVFCLGRNYADHAAERGAAAPDHPVYFTKPGTAVVGPGDDIVHHAITKELDYEVELAVVIGTGGRDIPRAEALPTSSATPSSTT